MPARLSRPLAAILVAALMAAGCSKRVSGTWSDSGERRFTGTTAKVDGETRADGHWTFWYADGETKQAQGWFDRGTMPGEGEVPTDGRIKKWTFWDDAGFVISEGRYKEGLRDELWACWKQDGELCCTGTFAVGKPDGFHATWFGSARVDEHYYAAGVLEGPRVVRDGSGEVLWKGEYVGGELSSAEPADAPEPALHSLEICASFAEQGRRTSAADHASQ